MTDSSIELTGQEYSEGYYYKGREYISRTQFYDPLDPNSLTPDYFTNFCAPLHTSGTLALAIDQVLLSLTNGPAPIYILYSGGIDSEMILERALHLEIPFIPVVVDLFGQNHYELQFAKKFIQNRKIKKSLFVEVSKDEVFKKWLPEFIVDSESLSFLLLGAYIGARACPEAAKILYAGENPDLLSIVEGQIFLLRHEYSLWSQKLHMKRHIQMSELFQSPDVIVNYLGLPAISKRLLSLEPRGTWRVDHESMGKEFIFSDPQFQHLERRYSQHGWESQIGRFQYTKGMKAMQNPFQLNSFRESPLLHPQRSVEFLLTVLNKTPWKPDLNLLNPEESIQMGQIKPYEFNRAFYSLLGQIKDQEIHFQSGQASRTITTPLGQIVSSR